jgi:predicted acylesterase/phospholipase RssA
MFGAYQAGVWQELADFFKPDIVVGASVGSLNGWLIASGCDPSELVNRWTNLESIERLPWRIPRKLSDGIIDSTLLQGWIQEMCDRANPKCQYGAVLTQVPSLKQLLFQWPDVTWQHVAGSCAVPGFLRHYRFDGHTYTDGGFLDPSPVWAAFEMGAEVVVSVNLLRHRPAVVRAMVKAAQAYGRYCPFVAGTRTIIDIDPSGRLGSATDSMYWSKSNAERWIERGRRDARERKHFLIECLGGRNVHLPHLPHERVHAPAVPLGPSHERSDDD